MQTEVQKYQAHANAIAPLHPSNVPTGIDRFNKRGRLTGQVFGLADNNGQGATAKQLRESLAKTGLKGSALKKAVGLALYESATIARARTAALVSYAESNHFAGESATMNKAGDVLTIRMVKVSPAAVKAAIPTVDDAKVVLAESLGMTTAQLEALLAPAK